MNRTATPVLDRIIRRLPTPDEGCWEWPGSRNRKGYGRINLGRRADGIALVHRVVWEQVVGPIPDGWAVLHACDNPSCARPSHLRVGTIADNNHDMATKGRAARQRGSANGRARLDSDDVARIRASTASHRAMAVAYGIGVTTVRQIRNGDRWKEGLA